MKRILLPLLMILTLTACSSPGPVASIEDRNQAAKGAKAGQVARFSGGQREEGRGNLRLAACWREGDRNGRQASGRHDCRIQAGAADPRKDPSSPLSKRSIYFDYDSNVVKDDYRTMIEAHAAYLVAHKDAKVTLQGNTDDRGSREYNLALGSAQGGGRAQGAVLAGGGRMRKWKRSVSARKNRAPSARRIRPMRKTGAPISSTLTSKLTV